MAKQTVQPAEYSAHQTAENLERIVTALIDEPMLQSNYVVALVLQRLVDTTDWLIRQIELYEKVLKIKAQN